MLITQVQKYVRQLAELLSALTRPQVAYRVVPIRRKR